MQTHKLTSNGVTSGQKPGMGNRQNASPKIHHGGGMHGNNIAHSSSGGHSQNSSGNAQMQFNQIRLQSEVLELIQTLSLDYDQMSPTEVRQNLRQLVSAEQEARSRREAYLNEILIQRVQNEHMRYKEQFDQLRIQFELETIKFEKVLKDRAQGVIKSLQIKQLDRLINMVGRIRQVHNLHGTHIHSNEESSEACIQSQMDLQNLISQIDNMMAELSSDESNSHGLSEPYNFASQEELQRKIGCTPFNPNLKDHIFLLQQQSSNGVVANNNRQNIYSQAVVASNPNNNSGPQRFAAATSYGGITSGEGLPIMSGSNILSPNTTPSQEFGSNPPCEATLSNPQIQRSNTTAANQLVKPGSKRPHFVYDLPPDFPFNEAFIDKSLSNDFANSAFKSGSGGNGYGGGSNSQHTASNHDVNPEDVLRTFTNSLHSGGTLGAIHSSLTYYKEALASKEFAQQNMSPSNAYHNFMWKKNLVGEIQKLAKEISRIPTEEAKLLADLSKSHMSNDGSRRLVQSNNHLNGQHQFHSGQLGQQPPPGMTTAEAISKGLGFIGNNESSIMMDLNRASIVAAQKEAEELRQKAKRIVDDSATRLEPVVKSFTDAPISQQLMQGANHGSGSYQNGRFIQYQQEPSSSLPDSVGLFPDQQQSNNQLQMDENQYDRANNESIMRDSCVMYDEPDPKQQRIHDSEADMDIEHHISPPKTLAGLNYHASNERSQLSEDEDGIIDEVQIKHQQQLQTPQQPRSGLIAQAVQNKIASQHRRHGSVVVGEHTIQNRIETDQPANGNGKKDSRGREQLNVYAERRSIQHERDELSPKQLRNESLSVQRSSIAAKRKVQQMGFFSNDAAATFTDMELDQIDKAQNFQQTASFAPKHKQQWWLEDAHEIQQNQILFQQTAGPNVQGRTALASKLQSSRRRGTQSVNSQFATATNFGSQNANGNVSSINNKRFGDQNLSNNALDNKGRAINQGGNQNNDDQVNSGNLYDELSRVAEYQSSRSVLDGQSQKALRNPQTNMNRTMQVKKKVNNGRRSQNQQQSSNVGAVGPEQNTTTATNREIVSKSVLTNGDRASPIPSMSGLGIGGAKMPRMNIKKTQIKIVGGIQNKRSSIQVAGSASTGQQSKSVSRDGRIKVKLVQKQSSGVPTPVGISTKQANINTTDPNNISRLSSMNNGGIGSVNTSQSPKQSRNGQRVILATGPSKSTQGHHIPTGVIDNQRQREFSPQHQQTNQHITGFQQPSQGAYTNKIPFKTSGAKREEASTSGPHGVRNNFFTEGQPDQQEQVDDLQQINNNKRQMANNSQMSAPIGNASNHQPLKIRRNRKQAKRITPTLEDNAQHNNMSNHKGNFSRQENSRAAAQVIETEDDMIKEAEVSQEREEADQHHFNDIARNLRNVSQQQSNNIFIRKGSHHQQPQQQQNQQQPPMNTSVNASLQYGGTNSVGTSGQGQDISNSSNGKSKSRQGTIVRTYKTNKSRQVEDLERPFGTERVSFHKSALVSNNQGNRKSTMTQDEAGGQVPAGYRRPVGSVPTTNNNTNAVTVRVQSHSQPPLGSLPDSHDQIVEEPQIIPPPTQNSMLIMTDQQREETSSTPGQMSGRGSVSVNAKRPVYKMTAINFIGNSDEQKEAKQAQAQVSSFASAQNPSTTNSDQFSFHHPQQAQPSQGKFPSHSKKASITAQLETSPYLTQQKVMAGPSSAAANKRVIHLKRPSTNFQMASSNQPNIMAGSKNAFAQRAASRVEHIDKQNELSFQNNGNNGTTSGSSVISAIQRPTTQIRIGKKTSVGGTQQTQVVIGASRANGNFMRPASDMSNGEGEYSYM